MPDTNLPWHSPLKKGGLNATLAVTALTSASCFTNATSFRRRRGNSSLLSSTAVCSKNRRGAIPMFSCACEANEPKPSSSVRLRSKRREWFRPLVAIVLLLLAPPAISRMAMLRRSRIEGEFDLLAVPRRVAATLLLTAMLQDMTVASACLALLLPVAAFVRCCRDHRGWRKSFATERSGSFALAFYGVYVAALSLAFVAPVWIDLTLRAVFGIRMRAEFAALMLANMESFSSSMAVYGDKIHDPRSIAGFSACLLSCITFVASAFGLLFKREVFQVETKAGEVRPGALRSIPLEWCIHALALFSAFQVLAAGAVYVSWAMGQISTLGALCGSNAVFLLAVETTGFSFVEPDSSGLLRITDKSRASHSDSAQSNIRPGMTSRHEFLLSTELYVDLDETGEFPYYRRTIGFNGTKNFNVKLPSKGRDGKKEEEEEKQLPNIVFLMLESWRHADVGVLGRKKRLRRRKRTATPHFDRLVSQRGVLFSNFYSNSVQTSRSIPPSLFGTLPHFSSWAATSLEHASQLRMSGLPTVLKSMNYSTHFFSPTDLSWQGWDAFLPSHGCDRLWGRDDFQLRYSELREDGKAPNRMWSETSWGMADGDAYSVILDEMQHLARSKKPFFIDFYSLSSHHPWDVPSGFKPPNWTAKEGRDDLHTQYLNALSYSDHALGSFFEKVDEIGLGNNTLFVVSGDHAFGFCEHEPCTLGWGNDKAKVWDEAVRVPMAIVGGLGMIPPSSRGRVIDEASSHVDLFSTIMDVVGVPKEGFVQHGVGRSLMRKVPEGRKDMAVLQNPHHSVVMGAKVGKTKYMFEGNGEVAVYGPGMHEGRWNEENESVPRYYRQGTLANSDRNSNGDEPDVVPGIVPEDICFTRDLLSDVLKGTKQCYESNSFIPLSARYGSTAAVLP